MNVTAETIDHLPNCTGNTGRYTELVVRITGSNQEVEAYRLAMMSKQTLQLCEQYFLHGVKEVER